jgi:hypothetical protein
MGRRFTFGDEDTYIPSRPTSRIRPAVLGNYNPSQFTNEESEPEENPDPYGYNEIISRYRKELGSEQPALARYRTELQNTPQQQDYDLGKWGKVGAALAGFGAGYQDPAKGIAVATQLREAPWQRALKQHDRTLQGLGTEAEFEQDDRKNRMAGLKLELDSVKDRRTADTNEMNIMSQVQRRRAQTKAELDRLGLDWKKYDLDKLDKMSDNERADLLARETERHNLATEGTADFNADSSRMNARTNQGNLGLNLNKFTYQQGRDNVDDYHWGAELAQNDRKIDNDSSASWLAPNVQRDAQDYVAQNMMQDPMYRDFFEDKGNGYMARKQMTAAQQLTPEYLNFEREFARQVERAENQRRTGTGRGTGRFSREQ